MKWLKNNTLIKIFLAGMIATLVYKYMQVRGRQVDLVPPQASETDRPLANGRMEFWNADAWLDLDSATGGNCPQAETLAKEFAERLQVSSGMKVFCMINGDSYVFLVRSDTALDEDELWSSARELVVAKADGVPTIGIGVRRGDEYRMIIVGGPDPEPILVKPDGPFTLYPYFYRAEGLNETASN